MKVLLTHAYYLAEDERELKVMKPYAPLGILCIAAYLEKNGVPNEVCDTTFSDFKTHCRIIKSMHPGVIGIYTNLMTRLNVLRLIGFVREDPHLVNTKIILGGPEVRHHAENFLHAGADYVVLGEGEETMLELVQAIKSSSSEIENIPGIASLKNGAVCFSPVRQNIKDIDALPFPARDKVDLKAYLDTWKKHHGRNAVSVSTMRGCPYTCKWCSRAVYGQSYRRRSPHLVADELEQLDATYGMDTIWFVDDVFTISHNWLKEFHDELKKRKLKIKYECITRSDRMNDEVIQLLKASGCYRVWIGAESGSQKIIDLMDRRVNVHQVRKIINDTRNAGLEAGTFIMLGYPGETEDDVIETLEHLKTSDPDLYTITIAYPIKGTPLYRETEPNFTFKPDWDKGSDRQIDFKRTYSRTYYEFAIRWISNEMALHKNRKLKGPPLRSASHKLKSIAARNAMRLSKWL